MARQPAKSQRCKMLEGMILHGAEGATTLKFSDVKGEVTLILGPKIALAPRKAPAKGNAHHIEQEKPIELVGTGEIAERCGVSVAAVSNWIARGHLTPFVVLYCGPIFDWAVVERWFMGHTQRKAV